MNNSPRATSHNGNSRVRVLTVMPADGDHEILKGILSRPDWNVNRAENLSSALHALSRSQELPAVVLCDRDTAPGSWKEILARLQLMRRPPLLIVASRLADEQLWAEALNLGAYDVLAKPFDEAEVHRALSSASMRWLRDGEHIEAAC